MSSLFDTLGVDWDADERTIKRAYAKLIKEYRPDSHPAEFARIREAYENALENARKRARWQFIEEQESIQDSQAVLIPDQAIEQSSTEVHEQESPQIAPYQRLPRNKTPALDEVVVNSEIPHYQRIPDSIAPLFDAQTEQEQLFPPYQRLPDERRSNSEDIEASDLSDMPEFQYEFSMDEFIEKFESNKDFEVGDHFIHELLKGLTSFNLPEEEPKALACFEAHIQRFEEMSLDQRMDYEDGLGNWLLYSTQPALLVFLAANKQFTWDEDHLNRIHNLAFQAKLRFANLLKLANFYKEANHLNGMFQQAEVKTKSSFLRLKTRAEFLERKNKISRWKQDCIDAELPALQDYFGNYSEKRYQIFAVDIFFALSLTIFVWWICKQPDLSKDIPIWLRLCIASAFIPASLLMTVGVRSLYDAIQAKPNSKVCLLINWLKKGIRPVVAYAGIFLLNTMLFSAFSELGILYFVIMVILLLSVPFLFLYGALAKVEKLITNLWWFVIDSFIFLEKTVTEITPNPLLKIFVRLIIYGGIPILLVKEYVPEMKSAVKKLYKSVPTEVLLKRILVTISVSAYFIYQIYKK